eukprot:12420650-Karenia_brevis.AAC.1
MAGCESATQQVGEKATLSIEEVQLSFQLLNLFLLAVLTQPPALSPIQRCIKGMLPPQPKSTGDVWLLSRATRIT